MRIGDTCDELLAALSGCDLGICWDTGHYMLSVERYGLREQPSDEFLGRVRAVHLHDVVDGKDHRPISPRSGRVRRFLEMLRGQGFGGTVTLEYDLDAFAAGGGVERVLTASLETLAVWTSY
jgi:sugar phosphate isomerase/epimerase